MTSFIGRRLGQYEITDLIGSGGMATVYRGFQESVGRYVAIKVLPPHPGLDAQFIQRFQLEAKTIGALQHPHILPLYDYGSTEDNILYLVMAYIDGGSLEDTIEMGPMQPKRVERILREIASAMDYAHRRGIIHRDIKPANILLDSEGHALLADFGIVKMMGGSNTITGTNMVGTPAYMSPEQAQGGAIDNRVDIYALGCVVYEMLASHQPYQSTIPMQMIMKHVQDPVPSILDERPDLPEAMEIIIEKAMAKHPNNRYPSAVDFAEDFSKALHGNTDSLIAIQQQFPLDKDKPLLSKSGLQPTIQFSESEIFRTQSGVNSTTSPTIIVQKSTNPLVIMGGFGLIALVIVVIAFLLLGPNNSNNNNAPNAGQTQTAAAMVSIPTPTPQPSFGELRFNTANSPGDTINLTVKGLRPPPDGTRYAVWLLNSTDNSILPLGEVVVDTFGEGALVTTDPDGRMLPAYYNSIAITAENTLGDAPQGVLAYFGQVPIEVTTALQAIIIADDAGIDGGSLLSGAQTEAETGANHAGLASKSDNVGAMKTHAEHTVNILLGTEQDYNGNGRGENPGRKIGVYFFLDKIEEHLSNAANAPGATISIQTNIETLRVCSQNVRDWADRVQSLEKDLLAANDLESVAPQAAESAQVATYMLTGNDANSNGVVEPFEGECGLNQIPQFSAQVGNMNIIEAWETN